MWQKMLQSGGEDTTPLELISSGHMIIQSYGRPNTISELSKKPKIVLLEGMYNDTIWVSTTIIVDTEETYNTYRDGNIQYRLQKDVPIFLNNASDNSITFSNAWGVDYDINYYIYG